MIQYSTKHSQLFQYSMEKVIHYLFETLIGALYRRQLLSHHREASIKRDNYEQNSKNSIR